MNLLIARRINIFDIFTFECNGYFNIVADCDGYYPGFPTGDFNECDGYNPPTSIEDDN